MVTKISGRDLQKIIDSVNGVIEIEYDASTKMVSLKTDAEKYTAKLTNELKSYFKKQSFGIKTTTKIPKVFKVSKGKNEFMSEVKSRGITFNQFCGYYFETIFFQIFYEYCGLGSSYAEDPGYQRQLALVNTFILQHPRMQAKIMEAGRELHSLTRQAINNNKTLLKLVEQIKSAKNERSVKMGESSNSPDDIEIIADEVHISFDLKSLTTAKTGNVEWIPYTSKTSEELGVTSFIDFIASGELHYSVWMVPDGNGGVIPDNEWVSRIEAGGTNSAKGYYIEKIAQQMTNILTKGPKESNNYLSGKMLIINSRPPSANGDWNIEVTVNMDEVLKILQIEESDLATGKAAVYYTTNPDEMPPQWRKLKEAYILAKRMQRGQDLLPLAAFSLPRSQIEKLGAQAVAKSREKAQANGKDYKKSNVSIGFALNHNALTWASKSTL